MTIAGKIIDGATKLPLPGATVSLLSGNIQLVATAADGLGNFSLNTLHTPTDLQVSSVGYKTAVFTMAQVAVSVYSTMGILTVGLARDYREMPGVTITAKKSDQMLWLFALIAAAVIIKKQKRR